MAQHVQACLTFKASEAFSLFAVFRDNLNRLVDQTFGARGVKHADAYITDDELEAWAGFQRVDVFIELECDSWAQAERVARDLLRAAADASKVRLTEDSDYGVDLSQSDLAENSSMFAGA